MAVLTGALLAAAALTMCAAASRAQRTKPAVRKASGERPSLASFGVVGDGQTDDTRAIQAAVDASLGELHFPPGTYSIHEPITIDLDRVGFTAITGSGVARLEMHGPGPALRFVGTHGGTADPKTVREEVWARQRMPIVDGLEIVGRHEQAEGIQAEGTMQLSISRLTVRDALHGIHLTRRNRNVMIDQCHLYHNRGIGIFLDHVNLHQTNIANCHISYNAMGGIVVRGGDVRNVQVGTCDIEANMSADTSSTANVLLECETGSVAEVAITGCTIQHDPDGPDSANIRILGRAESTKDGQTPHNYGHVAIVGNVLSDVQFNIDLLGVRSAIVEGNTLWHGFQQNLRIRECSHVIVGDNLLDRNPRYDAEGDPTNGVWIRDCQDSTIRGLHALGARRAPAILVENCRRMNISGCTVLDCDVGIWLKDVRESRLSDCLIRDDRHEPNQAPPVSLRITGGGGNQVTDNLLGSPAEIDAQSLSLPGN